MIKNLILLLLIPALASCEKSRFETLLTQDGKRWVYIDSSKVAKNVKRSFYLKFFPDGNCENHFISNNEKLLSIEGNTPGDWKYSENDSVLEIFKYHKFKILKYESDTIHMIDIKNNLKKMLVNENTKANAAK